MIPVLVPPLLDSRSYESGQNGSGVRGCDWNMGFGLRDGASAATVQWRRSLPSGVVQVGHESLHGQGHPARQTLPAQGQRHGLPVHSQKGCRPALSLPLNEPLHNPLEVGLTVVGPRCWPAVALWLPRSHFRFLQGVAAFAISSIFRWNQPFTGTANRFRSYTPNVAKSVSWLAQDVRSYPCPKIMSCTPTSFRAKIDGPNWAAIVANTPNPVRINPPAPPDRPIRSCLLATC